MRRVKTQYISNPESFKKQLLLWSSQFDEVVWLDSNNYQQTYASFDAVLAVEAFTLFQTDDFDAFNQLKEYQSATNDWIFGYLSYDLKNDVEDLSSHNFDGLEFPELYFFQPKRLFFLKGNTLETHYLNVVADALDDDLKAMLAADANASETNDKDASVEDSQIKIKLRIHKDDYFSKVNEMLAHIYRGDIYEANFCQEFFAENTRINPLETYSKLNAISKPPFASFLKLYDKYLLSASPERYIKKEGLKITSQPIKGTAKRSKNKTEDLELIKALSEDIKERSENIMIVDLVRNDLSKTATKGSVRVEELCKVYTFDQVHQMISTVTSMVNESTHPVDIIRSTFPMGSMTGAPKISAMKIIEVLEETKRGLYSGAVGYFSPDNNFDFNVVIRSILYNATKKYVSYSVGGAITAKSDPLKEYEECLIKAKAMREVLEN
ncbi:anthranilate synthase component I family protein [Psychroserpens sp. SPM9]|uniref:anthranilate synthase component I family protein n=1 Tax=Psychroserpens sp. SPM9 TaxID=2975598 RepID=UPI0021A62AEB|nr:anthranilate synthase component I family protein [Psychroserpens sp. SPM9]MDG5491792.1 anthranilate synthase component I family protein [Psychroserpens sp. SPM9]